MDVKQLAKGKRLGVAQLREISRDILNRAVALAQLNSVGAVADVAYGRRVAVEGQGVGQSAGPFGRLLAGRLDDPHVAALEVSAT